MFLGARFVWGVVLGGRGQFWGTVWGARLVFGGSFWGGPRHECGAGSGWFGLRLLQQLQGWGQGFIGGCRAGCRPCPHPKAAPLLVHGHPRQRRDLAARRDHYVFGGDAAAAAVQKGDLHRVWALEGAPPLDVLNLRWKGRSNAGQRGAVERRSKTGGRQTGRGQAGVREAKQWAGGAVCFVVGACREAPSATDRRAAPTTSHPSAAPPRTLFFLNSPSMPLVSPDTVSSLPFCMVPQSKERPEKVTPIDFMWSLASA